MYKLINFTLELPLTPAILDDQLRQLAECRSFFKIFLQGPESFSQKSPHLLFLTVALWLDAYEEF